MPWRFIKSMWRKWLLMTLLMTLAFYVFQLLALMIRFQQLPNYLNVHDWFGSLLLIVKSTPSLSDMLMIIKEEWLLEIGYMNYDYGIGISVWSLYLAPAKMLFVSFVASLVALNWLMLKTVKTQCSQAFSLFGKSANGLGAALFAITSITMSWVVCCATPTWVVGLAMLGLGVTAALQLETLGPALAITALSLIVVSNVFLSHQLTVVRSRSIG